MDLLDLILILLLIAMVIRGFEIGFIRQFFAAVGLIGGFIIGASIAPTILKHVHSQSSLPIWSVIITLGCAFLLFTLGEFIGLAIKKRLNFKAVHYIDSGLGSVISIASFLVLIWLASSILLKLPSRGLKSEIQQSAIISTLNRSLPAAPDLISRIGRILDPNGFPQVFIGSEPTPNTNVKLPTSQALTAAVNKDAPSVVKVEGLGCGGIVEGSGFVASNGYVITNAHVVAGIAKPLVVDSSGKHPTQTELFDQNLDIAVLKVNGLNDAPLNLLSANQSRGTQGAAMGYPGGGNLSASPAVILTLIDAIGRNIYNQGQTERNIYEIQADIIPGNSGGPLINNNGDVVGVVFAQSTVYDHIGYALTMAPVINDFNQAKTNSQPVSNGTCAE